MSKEAFEDDPVFELVGVCHVCVHRLKEGVENTCAAFPAGIPDRILAGIIDHTKPVPGDNGIFFKKRI